MAEKTPSVKSSPPQIPPTTTFPDINETTPETLVAEVKEDQTIEESSSK